MGESLLGVAGLTGAGEGSFVGILSKSSTRFLQNCSVSSRLTEVSSAPNLLLLVADDSTPKVNVARNALVTKNSIVNSYCVVYTFVENRRE